MKLNQDYLRSIIFGFEDGLVSTTGVVVGVSVGVQDKSVVILAGLVTIAVEALSMGAGQFISERAVHELEEKTKNPHQDNLLLGAVMMFVSYFVAGFIPLTPIILFDLSIGPWVAVAAAFVALFTLGYVKGRLVKVAPLRSAVEILAIGGGATVVGLVVGRVFGI